MHLLDCAAYENPARSVTETFRADHIEQVDDRAVDRVFAPPNEPWSVFSVS